MSIHKFASNVIERCLHFGTKEQKDDLINEIVYKDDNVHDSLINLVKDKFGNYVVQKMIEYSDPEQREQIIQKIISSGAVKKKDSYSKHVITCIEKLGYNITTGQKKQSQTNIPNNNIGSNSMNNIDSDMNNNMNNIGNINLNNINLNNLNLNNLSNSQSLEGLFNNNDLNMNQFENQLLNNNNYENINSMNLNNFPDNYQFELNDFNSKGNNEF